MVKDTLFSHKSDEWETPQWLFDLYNAIYHFDLDACATPQNAKCQKYYTKEDNGLECEWEGSVWCNPPYSEAAKWVEKAVESVENEECETVVMLLPVRTDTKWFHDYICLHDVHIDFLKGRLRFNGSENNAPFPSMIVIF